MNKNKKIGFTLAEVLIVIGIIGVVAALTLPNLNHATGDKEKVTKVKKIYSTLTEAYDRAQAIYGDPATWYNGLSSHTEKIERFGKRVTEFMKVSKDCGLNGSGCFANPPFYYMDGEELEDNIVGPLFYKVMLADGVSVAIYCGQDGNTNKLTAIKIRVDIDGPNKGKNQEGVDIFDFSAHFTTDNYHGMKYAELYPSGWPDQWINDHYWYETAWVVENGNLDYLKVDEDGNCPDGQPLNWETKTSCK